MIEETKETQADPSGELVFLFTKQELGKEVVTTKVKESDLTNEHKQILLDDIVRSWNEKPEEVKKAFIEVLKDNEEVAKLLSRAGVDVRLVVKQAWVKVPNHPDLFKSPGWIVEGTGQELSEEESEEVEETQWDEYKNPIVGIWTSSK